MVRKCRSVGGRVSYPFARVSLCQHLGARVPYISLRPRFPQAVSSSAQIVVWGVEPLILVQGNPETTRKHQTTTPNHQLRMCQTGDPCKKQKGGFPLADRLTCPPTNGSPRPFLVKVTGSRTSGPMFGGTPNCVCVKTFGDPPPPLL